MLLEPIGRDDASYPAALRDALWNLEPGETSTPIFLDEQYAVLMLLREIESADVEFDTVRANLEQQVLRTQQRILMDLLARQLLADATFTIIDDELKESWDNRHRRAGG